MKKIKNKKRKKPEWLVVALDIWHTKQYRSAIKLALYLIFVAAVLIFIQFNFKTTTYELPKDPFEQYQKANNYEYTYTVIENSVSNIIQGKRYQEKELFQIGSNQVQYLLNESQIIALLPTGNQTVSSVTSFRMDQVRPDGIMKLLDSAKEVSTTDYTTGEEEVTYTLPVRTFAEIYDGLPLDSKESVTIKTMVKEEQVTTIVLDLTNYRKLYVPTSNQYILKLEYRNYNQVEEF